MAGWPPPSPSSITRRCWLVWYDFLAAPDNPGNVGDLPQDDRIAVRADGDTVIAVYKAGYAGQDRCFDLKVGAKGTDVEERDC